MYVLLEHGTIHHFFWPIIYLIYQRRLWLIDKMDPNKFTKYILNETNTGDYTDLLYENNLGMSSVSENVPNTVLWRDFFNQSGKHALFQAQSLMTVNQERIAINLFNYINLSRHNLNLFRFSKRTTTLLKWGRFKKMGNGSQEGFTVFGLCSYHMSLLTYLVTN